MMMMMVVVMMVMVVSFIMTIRMEEKNTVVMIMIIIMIMMHFPITIPPTMRGQALHDTSLHRYFAVQEDTTCHKLIYE